MKEKAGSTQAEASTKVVDDHIMHEAIIDLTNTSSMGETPEESNATVADEVAPQVKEPASK